ncbi:hypothetical protein BUALT_Bualt10G0126500 [Buddleja alternifolia]|uniref:Uncharacterized protein n=1 Tax=Buddleja alternifolia TaxID=168488 RepID=A0AAV6WYA3_9LAMI|nr:hypothetical protein BUALT_Bualt10G0126500 [Buddleja alternifolia]
MGRKIPLVSFLCGAITCNKTTPGSPAYESVKRENHSDLSNWGGGEAAQTPPPVFTEGESPEEHRTDTAAAQPSSSDQQQQPQPLPPPPGGLHMRASSCHHQSNSSVSKLVSSLSMRVLGGSDGGGTAGQSFRPDEKTGTSKKEKKLKHEDSIWKKTIILGEKCRVPDEDDDDNYILYDEKGNRISTYHPKSPSTGGLSLSRQASCINQE